MLVTLAPVALDNFSMSLFLTRLRASIPSLARKCWARSSMPFWQMTTFAPTDFTFSTILRSIFSSSSRKPCSWVGSVISILASISVFLISIAASIRAILASRTFLGIWGFTGSLSIMMPAIISVSSIEPPCFLTTWTLSMSTE